MTSQGDRAQRPSHAHPYPSINIIGAGIAGLSLACHLRRRRIAFDIFDAASKPKGHNYGITISSWGYNDLIPAIEPKIDPLQFRGLTAVDRLIGGSGITAPKDKNGDSLRASDALLREVLARGHHINWDHKVVSAQLVTEGLKLGFENGVESIANITIDAGGERSGLELVLFPPAKSEILPYAVYHGSRYVARTTFEKHSGDLFGNNENVRSFPAPPLPSQPPSSQWHLQIAKAYITKDRLPSSINLNLNEDNEPIIEFRYTLSRPAISQSPDPLFNPSRGKDEAQNIPDAFYDAVTDYLSTPDVPPALNSLLSASSLREDRILNWLLRVKPLPSSHDAAGQQKKRNIKDLATHHLIMIGDAAHATPPVGSEGATLAMEDASHVARCIDEMYGKINRADQEDTKDDDDVDVDVIGDAIAGFYKERVGRWEEAQLGAKVRLRAMHGQDVSNESGRTKLSGKM